MALLPLRLFLGFTFTYAGLQKLANPSYLNGSSPLSVQATIHSLQHQSPIGFLLSISSHAPTLVGVLIALGELAVGLATLLGLWVRLTAIGGLMLATTFFLTVSWRTSPYYYGSDIVFMFAWSVPLLRGYWDGPTVDAWIRRRAVHDPDPARRALVLGGTAAGALAVFSGALAGIVAAAGRAMHTSTPAASSSTTPPSAGASPKPSKATSPAGGNHNGRVIASVASVAAGSGVGFQDNSGQPCWLIHERSGDFRAFSAICTHAGCPVQYDPSNTVFVCPCHGGEYDATNGSVIAGPPPAPLAPVQVHVDGPNVRLG